MSASISYGFGRVLRKLRKELGLTQEELGLEANLQRKFISSLELGEKEPSLTTVFKIARALKIKPGKLITMLDKEMEGE